MQPIHQLLFGEFPRSVATPVQRLVYSDSEFEMVFDSMRDKKNLYSSVGSRWPDGNTVCDEVFFDFDTPHKVNGKFQHKEFGMEMDESEKVSFMRRNLDVAKEILGNVLSDAKRLVRESMDRDIPVVTAFSGGGIHVHQLYEPEENPEREMESTGWYFTEELELTTADTVIFGDTKRLTRIPNGKRMDDGKFTGFFIRPYTGRELLKRDVGDLLHESSEPRPNFRYTPRDRPEMEVYEGYPTRSPDVVDDIDDVGPTTPIEADSQKLNWLEHIVKLPCLAAHAAKDMPEHKIRWSLVAYLFNIGANPDEVFWIIKQLNWNNFDPKTTKEQINSVWTGGQRNEHGCRWMMQHGFCTYQDNPEECPAHNWGGNDSYMDWEND